MPEFAGPPASATPSGLDLVRGLLGRLNAEHAGEHEVPGHAERIRSIAEGARIDCTYDVEECWWSIDVRAAAEPTRCRAKLTRLHDGRWRLWLASGLAGSEQLVPPCAFAEEFVQTLRVSPDDPEVIAQDLAARTGAHISLASGRLTVIAVDGRRCRGLVAADADGLASLFLLDGDAWAGAPSHVETAGGLDDREA